MTDQLPDTPRRFVAGAKCPQCQALDKVRMYRKDGMQYQECVSCGHRESMAYERQFRELETRVNRTVEEREQDVVVVKILDPEYPTK